MKAGLIVIDGQVDFCDADSSQSDGALPVKGASAAMTRVSKMIKRAWKEIDSLSITFDCHFHHHIAHQIMWKDKAGNPPALFYPPILRDDVCGSNPTIFASNPAWQGLQEQYLIDLHARNDEREAKGFPRIEHTIWPVHCVPDTIGFALHYDLRDAVKHWETTKNRPARRVTKGSNVFREHFSAFKAEVPDNMDPSTKPQLKLAETIIQNLDVMYWAGIAEDYCLMNSFIDFIEMLAMDDDTKRRQLASKMVFLEDGTAAVGAVPSLKQFFWDYMKKWGVTITTTDKAFS